MLLIKIGEDYLEQKNKGNLYISDKRHAKKFKSTKEIDKYLENIKKFNYEVEEE